MFEKSSTNGGSHTGVKGLAAVTCAAHVLQVHTRSNAPEHYGMPASAGRIVVVLYITTEANLPIVQNESP